MPAKMMTKHLSTTLSLIGHTLERFDVTLFAYVLPLLMPLFFPDSLSNSLSISLAAFAISYIARPFGASFFGQLGDRYGRKSVFLSTILLTILATLIIGFLPTYAAIGILAPILVMICRFLQGLAAGAEFVVGSVFVLEHHPEAHRGWIGGIITATGLLGALIAALFVYIASQAGPYVWRSAFMIGAVMTTLVYFLRGKLQESPAFLDLQEKKQTINIPLRSALRQYPGRIFLGVLLGGCSHMIFYTSTVYLNTILIKKFTWPSADVLALNVVVLISWLCLSLVYGWFSQRFVLARWLHISLGVISFLAIPLFYALYNLPQGIALPLFLISYIVIGAPFVCMLPGYFSVLFPVSLRLSGLGVSIMLGQALFGGTFPLMATLLVDFTGIAWSPGIMISVLTALTSGVTAFCRPQEEFRT